MGTILSTFEVAKNREMMYISDKSSAKGGFFTAVVSERK